MSNSTERSHGCGCGQCRRDGVKKTLEGRCPFFYFWSPLFLVVLLLSPSDGEAGTVKTDVRTDRFPPGLARAKECVSVYQREGTSRTSRMLRASRIVPVRVSGFWWGPDPGRFRPHRRPPCPPPPSLGPATPKSTTISVRQKVNSTQRARDRTRKKNTKWPDANEKINGNEERGRTR